MDIKAITKRFVWKENKEKYSTGESLFMGKHVVAYYGWNGAKPKGTIGEDYIGRITLRRMSSVTGTRDEVKHMIESLIIDWFVEALGGHR